MIGLQAHDLAKQVIGAVGKVEIALVELAGHDGNTRTLHVEFLRGDQPGVFRGLANESGRVSSRL